VDPPRAAIKDGDLGMLPVLLAHKVMLGQPNAKLSASEAPKPGRHHVGTPGDIISECPGELVGIRNVFWSG
jgi:hypothetical protein